MSHSQDLKQSAELAKKIQAQQNELLITQNSTQAAKNQWAVQKKQIADETEIKIQKSKQAIANAITESEQELTVLHNQVKEGNEIYLKQSLELERAINKKQSEVNDLEHTKKVLIQAINDLNSDRTSLKSEVITLKDELKELDSTKTEYTGRINDLQVEIDNLTIVYADKSKQLELITTQLDELETDFVTKKSDLEQSIAILEAKENELAQRILDNNAQDQKVRENLAEWDKKLAAKDKNLRIREMRVETGEAKIVQNANLLNL